MKIKLILKSLFSLVCRNKNFLLILVLFLVSFFLRAYNMDNRYPFGPDQVDNAWAAKNLLVNHQFPLVGMVAKGNTGFFIGPAYYYFVAFFYWLTNLNPIASRYIALTTSIFTFFVIFFVTKKLFNFRIALIACFIDSISFAGVSFDSVQWPVAFLPGVSLIIFYFLYKIINGKIKYIFYLALVTGFAFHIHFTAVFFPIIIVLCLPFFPRNKKMFFNILLSIPLFLIWFIPNLMYQSQNSSQLSNLSNYLNSYYHGFHLRRFFQLTGDGLIPFDPFLFFTAIKPYKILILPLFLLVFFKEKISKNSIIFSYLTLIFFLVPWLVFSTYKGEISDYYFSINRFIALFIISYLLSKLLFTKKLLISIITIIVLVYYSYQNLNLILHYNDGNVLENRYANVKSYIDSGRKVGFYQGVPDSYIYYYLMRKKGVSVY